MSIDMNGDVFDYPMPQSQLYSGAKIEEIRNHLSVIHTTF